MVVKPQLLWVDLEMTGLNVLHDRIIEVAALLTDYALTPVPNSSFHRIMHCEESILSGMDEWCTRTHGNSGLTESVKNSKYTIEGVQEEILAHLKSFGCQERTLLLSGNSIHADRMFLTLQMPALTSFLYHYLIQ
ncbi:protein of unknown function [Taphrina deformans PYCC 5710]|uniref:Exonuclease domain-containing protein n=1 Tax=Taphrina deformans (strain PYCC 5710 / ATCC 11124 / CBS 356.35 / IMI 108563 / JCM 9778 / NBRC 8474) TaxID=1097556 RepID=R4XEW0_TAPDE|nr:protein of unknown function [Taphrina deformans PYCC 5710]|eukprot:CCG84321.1 protein of unknown function [Taphrina deformans PYCC 5710]